MQGWIAGGAIAGGAFGLGAGAAIGGGFGVAAGAAAGGGVLSVPLGLGGGAAGAAAGAAAGGAFGAGAGALVGGAVGALICRGPIAEPISRDRCEPKVVPIPFPEPQNRRKWNCRVRCNVTKMKNASPDCPDTIEGIGRGNTPGDAELAGELAAKANLRAIAAGRKLNCRTQHCHGIQWWQD